MTQQQRLTPQERALVYVTAANGNVGRAYRQFRDDQWRDFWFVLVAAGVAALLLAVCVFATLQWWQYDRGFALCFTVLWLILLAANDTSKEDRQVERAFMHLPNTVKQ
jgi:peptidoglycan/LPS O-acetylase OafA/YrhL